MRDAIASPRSLSPSAADAAALRRAIERASAQLLGGPEPTLTVALAGGTGAGKSALINALAGSAIAESGVRRPTTSRLRIYHHRERPAGGLPAELVAHGQTVEHDRPELLGKTLVDTPDLDSYATEHRALAKALLKAAGLVLYVFSPQNYRDERIWSVLAEERRFSASAAVLNKADTVSPEDLETVTEDLRRCFAGIGLPDVRIFRTAAAPPEGYRGVNDLPALRAYLERELQAGDVARMIRAQRRRVLDAMSAEVERIAPRGMLESFDAAAAETRGRLDAAAARLAAELSGRLASAEADLSGSAVMRLHARFRGPLRTWMGLADFVRFGLPGLARRLAGGTVADADGARGALAAALSRGPGFGVEELLRGEALAAQDALYRRGLPVARWAELAGRFDPAKLTADIASDLEARIEAAVSAAASRGGWLVASGSFLGGLVPAGLVGVGLWRMTADLLDGHYIGLPFLGHLAAMATLFFLALHGVVGALLPSAPTLRGTGTDAARAALSATLERALSRCRADLAADLADLHEPLAALGGAVETAAVEPPPAPAVAPTPPPESTPVPVAVPIPAAAPVPPPVAAPVPPPVAVAAPPPVAVVAPPPVAVPAPVAPPSPPRLDLTRRMREAETRRSAE
jgi:energy-coupling factor transporter ATP-binding protein EcfA2